MSREAAGKMGEGVGVCWWEYKSEDGKYFDKINLNQEYQLMRAEGREGDYGEGEDVSQQLRSSFVLRNSKAMKVCLEGMLSQFLHETRNLPKGDGPFFCRTKPKIEISKYIQRIDMFVKCLPVTFVIALIYIDRLQNANSSFIVNEYSVHRVLICAVMIASKYSQDNYFSNRHYSKVGGINQDDIDLLEREFLHSIDFHLFVSQEEVANYAEKLDTFYEMLNPLVNTCTYFKEVSQCTVAASERQTN